MFNVSRLYFEDVNSFNMAEARQHKRPFSRIILIFNPKTFKYEFKKYSTFDGMKETFGPNKN
jgi:hypothetical protein